MRAFRSLALPCLIVAEKEGIACHSKYVHRSFLNANILEALCAAGEYLAQCGKKGYLIPTSDSYALFLAKQGPLPPYHIVNECRETIEMCLDKTELHALMEEAGLAYPKSYRVESARELETLKEAMFPLLVKPACTVGFVNHFEKANLLEKLEDIAAYVASVEKAGLGHHALVAQEFIQLAHALDPQDIQQNYQHRFSVHHSFHKTIDGERNRQERYTEILQSVL